MVTRDCHVSDAEAIAPLSRCLRRALGLTFGDSQTALHGGVLSVRLTHALTPMARLIAHKEAGAEIVEGAYEALLADCCAQISRLASQVAGLPVRRIRIAVDAPAEAVIIEFVLHCD